MSKKIRVGWDDLKPGDLIHVKGSTNTYRFKSRTDWHSMIKVEGDGVGVSATRHRIKHLGAGPWRVFIRG